MYSGVGTVNKNIQYLLLCEDKQTECFMRYFLYAHNIHRRKIKSLPWSAGSGSGEQYVRKCYPKELHNLRKRKVSCALFVCIDADAQTVEARRKQLADECVEQKEPNRQSNEAVAIFMPKRNIETWIQWLGGNTDVNEDKAYPHAIGKESKCKPEAKKLADMFIQNKNLDSALSSMQYAKDEYDKLNIIIAK